MERSVSPGGCSEEEAGPTDMKRENAGQRLEWGGAASWETVQTGGRGAGWCEGGAGDLLC